MGLLYGIQITSYLKKYWKSTAKLHGELVDLVNSTVNHNASDNCVLFSKGHKQNKEVPFSNSDQTEGKLRRRAASQEYMS